MKKIILISLFGLMFSQTELPGVYAQLNFSEPRIIVYNENGTYEMYVYDREWKIQIKGSWKIKNNNICVYYTHNNKYETESCEDYKIVGDTLYQYNGEDTYRKIMGYNNQKINK